MNTQDKETTDLPVPKISLIVATTTEMQNLPESVAAVEGDGKSSSVVAAVAAVAKETGGNPKKPFYSRFADPPITKEELSLVAVSD